MKETKNANLRQLLQASVAEKNPTAGLAQEFTRRIKEAASECTVHARNGIVDGLVGADQVVYIGGLNVTQNARAFFKSVLFVEDANVKECARRAAWLGNDETHYERRWTDKDVTDLKRLITLSANWIENVLLTRKYVKEMSK
jgi:hypothetical protein